MGDVIQIPGGLATAASDTQRWHPGLAVPSPARGCAERELLYLLSRPRPFISPAWCHAFRLWPIANSVWHGGFSQQSYPAVGRGEIVTCNAPMEYRETSFTASGCLLSVRGGDVADDLEEVHQDRAGIGLASCHAQLQRLHIDERNGANAVTGDLFDHEVR